MSSYRLVLLIAAMSLMAIVPFYTITVLAEQRGWIWINFEQAAVIGCLSSASVPLLVYAKSKGLEDKILTIVQVIILLAMALVAFISPYFQSRTVILYAVWFVCAAVGVTVAVRLTLRLAQKNGERLSGGEIDDLRESILRLHLLESKYQEDLYRAEQEARIDTAYIDALNEALEHVRSLRAGKEKILLPHASLRPPPIFGGEQDRITQPGTRARH
jgi:hypothetical protein